MINNIYESIPLSINVKGKLLNLQKPIVMGILNITNDSFYSKSRFINAEEVIVTANKMFEHGATIIDIGAASSRPGAKLIEVNQEIELLLPILDLLIKEFPESIFSVDTYNAGTAKYAINAGAALINDISAGEIDNEMFEIIASLNVPYIMMHMKGIPENMQVNPNYDNVVKETLTYFVERVGMAKQAGIKDLIIDPGFGFGKNLEHNYQLLKSLKLFEIFNMPILCGLSRKSIINKVINTTPDNALNGTTVLNTIALLNGAHILRVHDVLEAKQAVELVDYYSAIITQ
jgi:dihydropteroate synthase